jgi:hypothetical protein
VTERKPGGRTLTYSYRWLEGVPLRDGGDALQVNGVGVAVADDKGKIAFESAFATRLPVTLDHGAEIVACGRARWKIENESFNVLKNNGYHLAHHFGHGKQCLKRRFAALNLLAFAFHTVCDGVETLCQPARQAKGKRRRLFEHLRTITAYIVFPSWQSLMDSLFSSKTPPI